MTRQNITFGFLAITAGSLLLSGQVPFLETIYWTGYWDDHRGDPGIWQATPDGLSQTRLVTERAQGIVLDPNAGKMYWTHENVGDIRRANLDGSGAETVVANLASAEIAVDLLAGRIYWTSYSGAETGVWRSNLDGTDLESLVAGGRPYGLALDLPAGKMYLADVSSGQVSRADLDGSSLETLFNTTSPIGLALDATNAKLYWSSYTGVYRSNLDGTSSEQIVAGVDARGLALDPYAQQIYWADFGDGYIGRADLDGGNAQPHFLTAPGAAGVALVFTGVPEPRSMAIAVALLLGVGAIVRRSAIAARRSNAVQ